MREKRPPVSRRATERTRSENTPSTPALAAPLDGASILELQSLAGNRSVNSLLARATLQREVATAVRELLPIPYEWWSEDEVKAVQKELRRLRLYSKGLDGDLGRFTDLGLVEAFGGDDWRSMDYDAVLGALKAAKRPVGKGHGLRYAELFKDGVLDISLGMGYLEEVNPKTKRPYLLDLLDELGAAFKAKGYDEDLETAARIMKDAGRPLGDSAFGRFFVKENALVYDPPAADPRPIHVVIRLIANPTGSKGGKAAGAFAEGMTQGDVAYYSGHGRYGSGPDFDPNFAKFTLFNDNGSVRLETQSYAQLEVALEREHPRRSAWQQFLWRVENDKIAVELTNAGNLRLAAKNAHPGEFGGKLIYWAMEQTKTGPITGEGGLLAKESAAHPERKYRVLVFDGCRTSDYQKQIRSTAGYDPFATDIIETTRTVGFHAEAETFTNFVDSIVRQYSAEDVIAGMNLMMRKYEDEGRAKHESRPFAGSGFGDNPGR
jgi:hypothetical protein